MEWGGLIKVTNLYHLLQTDLKKIQIQRWDIGEFLSIVRKTKLGNNGELRQKNSFCLKELFLYEVPVKEDDFQEISELCKNLEQLKVQRTSLTRIPTEFSRLHHMQNLFLIQNLRKTGLDFVKFDSMKCHPEEQNNRDVRGSPSVSKIMVKNL